MSNTSFFTALLQYFYRVGILVHSFLLLVVFASLVYGIYLYNNYNLPAVIFFERVAISLANSSSPLAKKISSPVAYIANELDEYTQAHRYQIRYDRTVVGPSINRSKVHLTSKETNQRLMNHYRNLRDFEFKKLRTVRVASSQELLLAIEKAKPGDDIVISPGKYNINQRQIYLNAKGTLLNPIRIKADLYGEVLLELNTLEGFVITGDYWFLENLKINGVCSKDKSCEHAIHIAGAKHLIIRNNELKNFNSTIKANSIGVPKMRRHPDNVLIEHNAIYNESSRKTDTSVTLVDVVAGSFWLIRKNFIANNSKHGSDYISYALFLKGNGSDGIIENNIVDCQWSIANDKHTRIGISLGGGGTAERFCRTGSCPVEYNNGLIRNNLVANCSQDVAIYINKSSNTKIIHNSLLNTLGLDVRFIQSSASIINNVTTGQIRARDGGVMELQGNTQKTNKATINSAPSVQSLSDTDLCGFKRYKFSVAGALGRECVKKMNIEVISN
ncbi:chondroitinase-B domain-containing protein [Colwellia psychrerythraea]|uniref:Right handed beta helix domain-containing protein n=1 Tax=Colwellia psychrerythraea TaxID=28229 RepID=A0A099L4J3_COLPS|nr:chondroitinase-B domain-containing protein [Colwellia psychrerythraea]KGJ96783.1 hypothetical protein GAB14E_1659 [Colwellia psychrerythraea]